jgi:hypothetical protein
MTVGPCALQLRNLNGPGAVANLPMLPMPALQEMLQARKQLAVALATWLDQDLGPNLLKALLKVAEPLDDPMPRGDEEEAKPAVPAPGSMSAADVYRAMCLLGDVLPSEWPPPPAAGKQRAALPPPPKPQLRGKIATYVSGAADVMPALLLLMYAHCGNLFPCGCRCCVTCPVMSSHMPCEQHAMP